MSFFTCTKYNSKVKSNLYELIIWFNCIFMYSSDKLQKNAEHEAKQEVKLILRQKITWRKMSICYCSFQIVLALFGVLLAPNLAEEVSIVQRCTTAIRTDGF